MNASKTYQIELTEEEAAWLKHVLAEAEDADEQERQLRRRLLEILE